MNVTKDTIRPKGRWHDRFFSLAVAITGAAIVAGLWKFNRSIYSFNYETYILGNLCVLLFVPMLVLILFGEEPSDLGFGLGLSRKMRKITLALFGGLLIIAIPASRTSGFQSYYPIFRQFDSNVWGLGAHFLSSGMRPLIYGWLSYSLYMFCWEFFFRGYLLFGLARTIKWPAAILLQAVAFALLHIGKVPAEAIVSFPAGIILGILAMKSKSFVPGFFLHTMSFIAFDVLVLISLHKCF